MKNKKTTIDYVSDYSAWILGAVMFVYLGYRTLDFLTWTFRAEDQIFAWLGLFSTTGGAIIFALIYSRAFYFDKQSRIWRSDEAKKAIALPMIIVCALGEVALAVADMTLIVDAKSGSLMMTDGELKTMMWLTAGLAGAVGAAVAAIKMSKVHPATDPEYDMSLLDADNDGVMDSKQQPTRALAQDTKLIEELARAKKEIEELKKSNPTKAGNP